MVPLLSRHGHLYPKHRVLRAKQGCSVKRGQERLLCCFLRTCPQACVTAWALTVPEARDHTELTRALCWCLIWGWVLQQCGNLSLASFGEGSRRYRLLRPWFDFAARAIKIPGQCGHSEAAEVFSWWSCWSSRITEWPVSLQGSVEDEIPCSLWDFTSWASKCSGQLSDNPLDSSDSEIHGCILIKPLKQNADGKCSEKWFEVFCSLVSKPCYFFPLFTLVSMRG